MSDEEKVIHNQNTNQHGPRPAIQTRRVMIPLGALATLFVLVIGFNSPEPPAFRPLSDGADGLLLALADSTPASSRSLEDRYVPADQHYRERVLARLEKLNRVWRQSAPQISVTPMDIDAGTVAFAQQLDGWFQQYELHVPTAEFSDGMGEVSHPPAGSGFVIRCRKADRAIARDLALAMAPVVRGEVSILFSEQASPRQLDIYIEGAPRFSETGVAYFPGADLDA
jgi:hypothetical protein